MITQEAFDKAYKRIGNLRDQVAEVRSATWRLREKNPKGVYETYGQEKGLSQALVILEEAERNCDENLNQGSRKEL